MLSDHLCDRSDFPCHTTQILTDHSDEIWVCAWSHDGLRLATGSKDSYVIIWQMDPQTRTLTRQMSLEGHTFGVSCIAWSPDDTILLVCGYEDSSDLWIWNTIVSRLGREDFNSIRISWGRIELIIYRLFFFPSFQSGNLRCKMNHSADDSLTTCAWQATGTKFVCGGTRGQFYQCDITGQVSGSLACEHIFDYDYMYTITLNNSQCVRIQGARSLGRCTPSWPSVPQRWPNRPCGGQPSPHQELQL